MIEKQRKSREYFMGEFLHASAFYDMMMLSGKEEPGTKEKRKNLIRKGAVP
jgi:hypothetical protein